MDGTLAHASRCNYIEEPYPPLSFDLFIFDIRGNGGPVIKRNNDPDIPVKRSSGDNDSVPYLASASKINVFRPYTRDK